MDMDRQLYQISEIRLLEQLAIKAGISEKILMERAALAAFHVLEETWPNATRLLVCCGHGNNGGDGYTLARIAKEQGYQVSICYVDDVTKLKGAAKDAFLACQKLKIDIEPFAEIDIESVDVVIDALLGIGLKNAVSKSYQKVIESINQTKLPVLALDTPSGIQADTGSVLGMAVVATVTVSFIGLKRGLFTGQAPAYTGKIYWDKLSIPEEFFDQVKVSAYLLINEPILDYLPPRPKDAHKGSFGHVLVIGGYKGMAGAARMAAEAAYRVGAGLVTVATLAEHVLAINATRPEIMTCGIQSPEQLIPLIEKATCVVIGPGLGQSEWSLHILQQVLTASKPLVVDADALNLLAQHSEHSNNWILTPHPGELSRLLDCRVHEIQANRFDAVEKLQQEYGGIGVLKGAGTIIKGIHTPYYVCATGNPGMASGGMGDVLSGVIAGLVAQGLDLGIAACLGVYIHGLAGDQAAQISGERGMLAMDLVEELRSLVNGL